MKLHITTIRGKRNYNEDRYSTLIKNSEVILGLFDGHGGDHVSELLQQDFLQKLYNYNKKREITTFFKDYQDYLFLNHHDVAGECGSTVLVTRINHLSKTIQVVSLGDSRGILCCNNKVTQLNPEHKPDSENEKLRITLEGSRVRYDREDEIYRIEGYAVSRSLGDLNYPIISQKPFVCNIKYHTNLQFILLASDGLWDVMSNEEVTLYVLEKMKRGKILKHTTEHIKENIAYSLGKRAIKKGSLDNITIIIYFNL